MEEEKHLEEHNNIPDKECETCKEIILHRLSHAIGDAFENMPVGDALDFLSGIVTTVLSYVPIENQNDAFGEFVRQLAWSLEQPDEDDEESIDPDRDLLN